MYITNSIQSYCYVDPIKLNTYVSLRTYNSEESDYVTPMAIDTIQNRMTDQCYFEK